MLHARPSAHGIAWAAALLLAALDGQSLGQPPPAEMIPPPTTAGNPPDAIAVTPPSILGPDTRAIDFDSALRLAGVRNPELMIARERITEAAAQRQLAAAQILPNINAGTNYDDHSGNLQQSTGQMLTVHRQALYVGAGAGAIGAGTVAIPGVVWNAQLLGIDLQQPDRPTSSRPEGLRPGGNPQRRPAPGGGGLPRASSCRRPSSDCDQEPRRHSGGCPHHGSLCEDRSGPARGCRPSGDGTGATRVRRRAVGRPDADRIGGPVPAVESRSGAPLAPDRPCGGSLDRRGRRDSHERADRRGLWCVVPSSKRSRRSFARPFSPCGGPAPCLLRRTS